MTSNDGVVGRETASTWSLLRWGVVAGPFYLTLGLAQALPLESQLALLRQQFLLLRQQLLLRLRQFLGLLFELAGLFLSLAEQFLRLEIAL